MRLSWENVLSRIGGIEEEDFYSTTRDMIPRVSWIESEENPKTEQKTVNKFVQAHNYDHKSAKGLRVKIIETEHGNRSYGGKFTGCTGTIVNGSKGVKIDGHPNPRSKYDCYWFKEYELEIIDESKEDKEMAQEVTGNYKVARVRFLDPTSRLYEFALFPEEETDVSLSEYALVESSIGSSKYSVVKVEKIVPKEEATHAVTKEIICPISFKNFEHRKEVREGRKRLKAKMNALVEADKELLLFKAIAEKNPEMAKMLDEYEKLGEV